MLELTGNDKTEVGGWTESQRVISKQVTQVDTALDRTSSDLPPPHGGSFERRKIHARHMRAQVQYTVEHWSLATGAEFAREIEIRHQSCD